MELRCLRSFFDSMKYNMDGRWIREERKQKNMNEIYEKLEACVKAVQRKTDFQPQIALVLGSGLGDYADTIRIEQTVEYREIEGFPMSTVAGHKGRFVFGYVGNVPVVAMQGRVHYYEGYSMEDVVLPIRVMGMLGAKKVILTNAAGGVNFDYRPGDLMLITDHITTAVPSPLIGVNIDQLGSRFPDMSEVYSRRMPGGSKGGGRNAFHFFKRRSVCTDDRSGIRNTGRDSDVQKLGRRCGGNEHGMRSYGGQTYGAGSVRDFLHYQSGSGNVREKIKPRGGAGDGRPRGSRISEIDYREYCQNGLIRKISFLVTSDN